MALVLPVETHENTYGLTLEVYKKILFLSRVNSNVLALLAAHRQLLYLLVVTIFVSLVVQEILRTVGFMMLTICAWMVSSVEQSREGAVELLVYHGSTRHYLLPPVTTLNWDSAVTKTLVTKMFFLACMRFMWNSTYISLLNSIAMCWTHCCFVSAAWVYLVCCFCCCSLCQCEVVQILLKSIAM